MKIKSILLTTCIALFAFTSCQDNKKKDDMKAGNKMEGKEMNNMEGEDMAMDESMNETKKETNTVADITMGSEKHTTLVKAIKTAGLAATLKSEGPYTVFAPTNSAFEDLPKGAVDKLMRPENSEKLEAILSYHVVPGNVDSAKLTDLIKKSENGEYTLKTANNGELTATINDAGNVILTDGAGNEATVVAADMTASNGVVHSINSVLMRK